MEHVLQLYQEESCLLDALAEFVAAGLRLEEGVLIVGSTPRWDLLIDRLQKSGVDARAHASRGQLKLYGVLELYQGIYVMNSGVAHFAHLGGMLGGWLMIQYRRRGFPFRM